MKDNSTLAAAQSLKKNGKTFWLASLILPRQIAAEAAILYAFCRRMDDLADQHGGFDAQVQLGRVQQELRAGRSDDPVVSDLIELADRRGLDLGAAACLLDVLLQDAAAEARLANEAELLRYCYGAAGTVGLMMSAVLEVTEPSARVQAIDLGIAMQLTNIARDVQEDARMGRRYLPAAWVGDLAPAQIATATSGSEIAEQIKPAVAKILDLADIFYASGALGFRSIPPAARQGIRVAAAVYRQIGVELRGRGCDVTRGRVVVSMPTKLWIAAGGLAGFSGLRPIDRAKEVEELHRPLAGLAEFR